MQNKMFDNPSDTRGLGTWIRSSDLVEVQDL